jgi:hypothetical protein
MAERTGFARKNKLISMLISDPRGAVALEAMIVYLFLGTALLLPLADVAAAGFQYISAWQSLRAFGQSIQYAPPADVTKASDWETSARAKADTRFPIPSIQLLCGASTCAATPTASPKYYSYTTTVTLAPIFALMRPVLCTSGNPDPCSFTLSYSERFQ